MSTYMPVSYFIHMYICSQTCAYLCVLVCVCAAELAG